ncbi:chemotaxis protein CheA [Alkalispirillum mobile]|nr:chemotaxis protein CheA [Alkalispirillum mobile]
MSIDMGQFLQTFFEESFEGLQEMEAGLLALDSGDPDTETLHTIFRAAHSIKGGAGTFGLQALAGFTHHMETLLDRLREGRQAVTPEAVNLLLESVDCLRGMLEAAQDGGEADPEQAVALEKRLAALVAEGNDPSPVPDAPESEESQASQAVDSPAPGGWRIGFRPEPHLFMTGNDPLRLVEELAELGEVTAECDSGQLPAFGDLDPEQCHLSWTLTLQGGADEDAVREVFEWVEDDCELTISPLAPEGAEDEPPAAEGSPDAPEESTAAAAPDVDDEGDEAADAAVVSEAPAPSSAGHGDNGNQPPAPGAGGGNGQPRKPAAASSIRVNTDKIDALIDMVGELVITQSMLNQLGEDFSEDKLEQLRDGLGQLERNTRELQENVMRIRMVPISFAYARLPRIVHDLSDKLGKQVELKLEGEQTELDKTVMEKLIDPLVHLVRNSLDHGIEPPAQRRELGKPETGTLEIEAYHKGGYIVIEINDDGAGISRDKLLAKARAAGLLQAGEELPDEQVLDLIFHPGLSTAEEATDVSGRGVGMDVVKRNIRQLGGNINLRSQPGEGTQLTIHLPLTLSILDGQLFRVGGQVYIVPLVSIIESLQIQREKLSRVAGKAELYHWREGHLPVLRLRELFNEPDPGGELANGLMVVVEDDDRRVGLHVDELLGQQQVVIKSLEANYQRVTGFAGATILGDGTVALILDIAGLVDLAQAQRKPADAAAMRVATEEAHGEQTQ